MQLCTCVEFIYNLVFVFHLQKVITWRLCFVHFTGHTSYLETGFEGTESNAGKIAIGLYNGMWAYDGW